MKKATGIVALCLGLMQGCATAPIKTAQEKCIEQLTMQLQRAEASKKYEMIIEMKYVAEILTACGYRCENKEEQRTAINTAVYLAYPEIGILEDIKQKLEDTNKEEEIALTKKVYFLINSLKRKGFDVMNYHKHAIDYGKEAGLLDENGNPIQRVNL